ncbi:hypothetical protein BDV06DRAFT_235104 [Aspergillus oleicola]
MAECKSAHTMLSPELPAEDSSPIKIFWDGDADPSNPKNWSAIRRWWHVILVSIVTFVTSLASSMLAPAVPDVMDSLHSDNAELESFVVSIYVIGFAVGPLVVAPLSELYGRAIVYHVSNVIFLGATIGSALSTNVGMFLAFRLLSGCAGVTPLALGGGSISDLLEPEQMGTAMAIWGLGSLIAPVFAPIAGGYLSEDVGWRWIFWVIVIPMGILTILFPFLIQETYAPVLLERKASRLRKSTGNPNFKSKLARDIGVSQRRYILQTMIRPLWYLVTSPILMLLALNVAVVYGYQYLVFTTLSYIFQETYGLSSGTSGLVYLGNGIGSVLGVFIIGYASDKVTARRKRKLEQEYHDQQQDQQLELPPWNLGTAANAPSTTTPTPTSTPNKPTIPPSSFLWPMIPSSILVPPSLLWYGWSLQHKTHPVLPLVGLGVFGFAMMGIFQPPQIYVVNAFGGRDGEGGGHGASALAGVQVLRSLVGALLPLGGRGLYDALGMGWGDSLLAFISLALVPVPVLLVLYGERLRGVRFWGRGRKGGIGDV